MNISELTNIEGKKVIAVCSGGLDSTASMLYYLENKFRPIALHFNYGQLSEPAESHRLKLICASLDVPVVEIDLRWLGSIGGSPLTDKSIKLPRGFDSVFSTECWVPARNVIFLSYAAALAERSGATKITFGAESSESFYPDNSQEFVNRFNSMLQLGTLTETIIETPFIDKTKTQIVNWLHDHDYSHILALTWSCDQAKIKNNEFIPCGECGCCNSRRYAFMKANKLDKQIYINDDYFYNIFLKDLEKRENEKKKVMKEMKY